MEKRLYVAWNNFTRHRISCPNRSRWLDEFLGIVLEQQDSSRVPQFFRGMSSVLTEQLLHDVQQMGSDLPNYFLRRRGWLLLHALVLSNLRNLTGVMELAELLMKLCEMQSPEDDVPLQDPTIPSWPMSQLDVIIARSDLKSAKTKPPRSKELKRTSRLREIKILTPAINPSSSNNFVDHSTLVNLSDEHCCLSGEDQRENNQQPLSIVKENETTFPSLSVISFHQLVFSLLEQLVGHHGNVKLESTSKCLDQSAMSFALERLSKQLPKEDTNCQKKSEYCSRLLRLVLRSMVSIVQHRRPLPADDVILQLIDVAYTNQTDSKLVGEVVECLVRFLAAVNPIDGDVHFNQWLNSFHSQNCLQLLLGIVATASNGHSTSKDLQWVSLIGTIVANMTGRTKSKSPCLFHHHHHIFGRALTDPELMDRQSCSISSLFYFLLQIYRVSPGQVEQSLALKAMVRARPCCCMPPDLIYQILFERVIESTEFIAALEVVFRGIGFAASDVDVTCSFCRNNGGQELERCRRMGVYASTESLSQSCWLASHADPWRSFDFYADFIVEKVNEPFSLTLIQHLKRMAWEATAQVQAEIFGRILYPILAIPTSTDTNVPSERTSIVGQITELCWSMTTVLVRQRGICELFLNSNGLELLLNYCRCPEWSSSVARTLQSLILIEFQMANQTTDTTSAKSNDGTGSEATALSVLDHLLLHHTRFVLKSLEINDSSADDIEWIAAGSFDLAWVAHLELPERLINNLSTASALWATVIRFFIRNRSFASWLRTHSFIVPCIERTTRAICRYLSNSQAQHWTLYAELLELFITLNLVATASGQSKSAQLSWLDDILQSFTPRHNLPFVYEIVLRCSTLERWISAEKKPIDRANVATTADRLPSDNGYDADDEPSTFTDTSASMQVSSPCEPRPTAGLFFPIVIRQLMLNFAQLHKSKQLDEDCDERLFFRPLHSIAAICSYPSTAAVLNQFDLLTIVLAELKMVLIRSNPHLHGVRQQLLAIISNLARQRITANQLQLMLDLFKECQQSSWSELLPVLLNLVRSDGDKPTHCIAFPGPNAPEETIEDSIQLSSGDLGSFVQVNDIRHDICTLAKHAKELGRLHRKSCKNVASAWQSAAIFLPILATQNWNMQSDGVALSTWLFLSDVVTTRNAFHNEPESTKKSDLMDCTGSVLWQMPCSGDNRDLHLFSMGTRSFLVEFWADPSAENTLLIRASQSTHSSCLELASKTMSLKVPSGRWNHLAVNCGHKLNGSHRTIRIQVTLNGCQSASLELHVTQPPAKRIGNVHSFLLLGMTGSHNAEDNNEAVYRQRLTPSWYLGHATLYKGQSLSPELAALLTTLGPDAGIFFASCQDGQQQPNFPRYLQPKLMTTGQTPPTDWDKLLSNSSKMMETLQANLMMTYSAHMPDSVFIYPCIISPTAGLFGSILPVSGYVFNAVSTDPRSSQQPPLSLPAATTAPLKTQPHVGIRSALKQLGGYSVLFFLLGHAVDSSVTEDCQALALEILLKWLRLDSNERQLFIARRGHWMLRHLLESERCKPSKTFASVLINLSCSAPVALSCITSGKSLSSALHSDALIVDPELLAFTVQCWKLWQQFPDSSSGAEGDTLDLLLRTLQHLLRDNHPHRQFNVRQMERARILPSLLHMATECSMYQDCSPLTEHQALRTADLIEGLIGSPPSVEALTAVVDYLLVLHPSEQTGQANTNGVYFLVSPVNTNNSSNKDDPVPNGVIKCDLFQPRTWKLPEGYETYAPQESNPQPMNANKLGSALRDVILKWSDSRGQLIEEPLKETTIPVRNVSSSSSLCNIVREEADTTLSLHLLRILTACVRVLPDSMVKPLVSGIIRPDVLLILAGHKRDRMRASAVRLLHAVLSRSDEEEQNFVRQSGLLILTNQLQPYAATAPIVEACLNLCVGADVDFVLEQFMDPFVMWPENPSPFQLQATILLLSLLPNAALDPALFHQLATLIRTLASGSNAILKFMLDFGLVEVLAKSVVALAHATKHSPDDVLEQREDEILMEAIHRILVLITIRTVNASGSGPWSVFQDMVQLFHYMERIESGLCGWKARCVRLLHESGCVILKQAFQTAKHQAETSGFNHHNTTSHSIPFHQRNPFPNQPGSGHFPHVTDKVLGIVLPVSLNRRLKLEKAASQSEVLERFRYLLTKSVDHVKINVELNMSSIEMAFGQDLLLALVRGLSSTLERPKSSSVRQWSPDVSADWSQYHPPDSHDPIRLLFWNCRQTLKMQLNRLLLFLSNPIQQEPSFLYFVIRTLHDDPHHEELFKLIPANEADFTYTLDSYLCHFLHSTNCSDNVEYGTLIRIHCISRCLITSYPPRDPVRRRCRVLDITKLKDELKVERDVWWQQQEEAQSRILSRYDTLLRQMTEMAARWTRQAVDLQHGARRSFFDRIRRDHGFRVQSAESWMQLVQQMSHQRAAWYFANSYLRGWQLDSCEGFQRMHLRLERCALNIDAKYLLPRSQSLLEPESMPRPLESILRSCSNSSSTGHNNNNSISSDRQLGDAVGCDGSEKTLRVINCFSVTKTAETAGELILTDRSMAFLSSIGTSLVVPYDDIREIHPRRFQLQDRALEFFLANQQTLLIVIANGDERNGLLRLLTDQLCDKLLPTENLAEVTQLWRESHITNFEYLVYLNKIAGRSYNDLMQYPIFPFVLADYESAVLNLDDPHIYRNFKKPMAVQNEHRDQHYIENYNYLKRDFENRPDGAGPNFGPFHYGSLYSNPGIVLHFLVRLPPFTKLLMEYQDRNFDVPDRSFHSVGTSWRLASSDSTTDVKELIPEFFFLPEFLVNSLGFDFGLQQSGEAVDDVQLPPWSQGKPRLFIQIHRQALESSWVRDHLHHWIDLIFGFKQSGPAAIESINVFHPSTYAGFDTKDGTDEDPIEKSAKITMIRSYGQVPRQLFRQPHPMSVQPLLNAKSVHRSAGLLPSVDHLKWGCYVGSPACQDPVLKHRESFAVPVQSFLPLRTGDTYALGPFTAAIVSHSYDKDSFLGRPTGILGVGLILWGQSDGIVRIKIRKDEPVKPLFHSEACDSVILCAAAPDYNQIWVAYRSGLIRVFPFLFDPLRSHFELTGPPSVLVGHVGPLTQIILCPGFSLAVSAGSDGILCLWDLHRLTFIRQIIPGRSETEQQSSKRPNESFVSGNSSAAVAQLAVSRNTADIACAVHVAGGEQSRLELRSVNGTLIGITTTRPIISSLCFSTAPEGISINVLAAGLSNGHIRLWDTWTLNPVRDIVTDSSQAIVSLAFSSMSQHLLAARSDGCLLSWESPHNNKKSSRYPPFINLTLQ